jgi:Patatin-like phospholipase
VDECIEQFIKLSKEIFKIDNVLAGKIPTGDDTCRFDYKTLEEKFQDLIEDKLGDKNHIISAKPTPPKTPVQCRTFVVATMSGDVPALPTIFRSYPVRGDPQTRCPIWQAARATTAAPTFFMSMSIGNPSIRYIDGGLGHNNPSQLALTEARRIWGQDSTVYLLSVGTGHQSATSIDDTKLEKDMDTQITLFNKIKSSLPDLGLKVPGWKTAKNIPRGTLALLKMANALSNIATNTEIVHDQIQGSANGKFPYFRFNVHRGVGDIGLQEYRKQHELATGTVAYLKRTEIQTKKIDCASMLIDPSSFFRK